MPFPDPEAAARGDIPERHARTLRVAMSPDGDKAVVLLATNEEYPIQVVCYRTSQGWEEEFSGNGPGWSAVGDSSVATYWGEADEQASAPVTHKGERHEAPVENGFYFLAFWDARAADVDPPADHHW